MTITREQVAALQPGDVVEIHRPKWTIGTIMRGPLVRRDGSLYVGDLLVQWTGDGDKRIAWMLKNGAGLTVISRAPRPLYVNHDRTEPRRGDVVRFDPDGEPEDWDNITWFFNGKEWRQLSAGSGAPIVGEMPRGLTLLVDGETGQAVQ